MENNPKSQKKKLHISNAIIHLGLIIFLAIDLAPLIIVFSSAMRRPENQTNPLKLFSQISGESFKIAFTKMNYPAAFLNSLLLTAGSVLIVVIFASMAAYPLGRINNSKSRGIYMFFISGLIVPAQMVIIPIALTFSRLHMPSTRFTPMIMFITCSLPFSVFLYTGFMKGVPTEVEESAFMDGAGLLRRFWQIVFPLLAPATVAVIITQGIWIWNDYFFSLIFINKSEQMGLPLAMMGFMGDKENQAQWNTLFAGCILCAAPLVIAFFFLQKRFVSGISAGAVKG